MKFPRAINGALSPGTWRPTVGECCAMVCCPECGSAIHLPQGNRHLVHLVCPSRSCGFEDDHAVLLEDVAGVVTQP